MTGFYCSKTGGSTEYGQMRARVYAAELGGQAGKEKWTKIELRTRFWRRYLGGAGWATELDRDYHQPHADGASVYWQNEPYAPKLPQAFDFQSMDRVYILEARFSWYNDASNLPPGRWDRRAHEGWVQIGPRCAGASMDSLASY